MKPGSVSLLSIAATAVGLLAQGVARAADPTTADCLAASDASLNAGMQHKLRAERSQLLVCAAASCPIDIRKECVGRVDEVNKEIPTVIFAAKDGSGADLGAVKVTMDGEVLAERLQGTALPMDPGDHTFVFEIAGQAAVVKKFTIQQAQKDRREVITFGTSATTASNEGVGPQASGARSAPPGTGTGHRLGPQRILAIAAGGIGVVGLGVGAAFGFVALSKKSDARSVCPGSQCTTLDGVNRWSDAAATGNVSTLGLIIGGIAIAGATALWLTAPSASTQVGIGPAALQVKGTW